MTCLYSSKDVRFGHLLVPVLDRQMLQQQGLLVSGCSQAP